MAVIECEEVTKAFGGLVAVDDLTFSVDDGEFFAIVGPNGAGKTTLFGAISGLSPATAGVIRFDGREIQDLRPHVICRLGLARTFQTVTAFDSQNVLTNVLNGSVFGQASGSAWFSFPADAVETAVHALDLVGLADQQHVEVAGMPVLARKRLMLATALATQPRVLMLDEPVGGLNAAERGEFIDVIGQVASSGVTVLMIEHVMKAVQALATRMMVLHHGRKIAEGSPKEVLRDERVVEVYLAGQPVDEVGNGAGR